MLKKEIKLKFNPKIDSYSKLELYISQALDKVFGSKTSRWVVGHTQKNRIYLLSPSVFEKASNHLVSDFLPVLTHEIAHIFMSKNLLVE